MALDIPGIEKIVYKADAGDITISGNDLNTDWSFEVTKVTRNSSRGTQSTTGNKTYDFTFNCYDFTAKSALEADEDNFNDLDIYVLGNTGATPDLTLTECNPIVSDSVNADPESEDGGYFTAMCRATIPNS